MKYFPLLVGLLLFGCSSITQIEHVKDKGLLINNSIYIREYFVEQLWLETGRVTGVGGSAPEIHFALYSPTFPVRVHSNGRVTFLSHYGRHHPSDGRAFVYFGEAMETFDDPREIEASIYVTLAHEYLHPVYEFKYKGQSDAKFDHCKMIESGDLEKLIKYIKTQLEVSDDVGDFHLGIVEKSCHGQR